MIDYNEAIMQTTIKLQLAPRCQREVPSTVPGKLKISVRGGLLWSGRICPALKRRCLSRALEAENLQAKTRAYVTFPRREVASYVGITEGRPVRCSDGSTRQV